MKLLVEICGIVSFPLSQQLLLLLSFTRRSAGGAAFALVEEQLVVTPLELVQLPKPLPEEEGGWDIGRLAVITGVRVGLVWGRGGLA